MVSKMAEMALELSESQILPFDRINYSIFLENEINKLEFKYTNLLEPNGASFKYFRQAVRHFREAVCNFTYITLPNINRTNPLEVRKINDQLMQVERGLIDPHGLPNRPEFNHIVFSPSSIDKYSSNTFAGLVDLFRQVSNPLDTNRNAELWTQIKQHFSVISFLIGAAADSLSDTL